MRVLSLKSAVDQVNECFYEKVIKVKVDVADFSYLFLPSWIIADAVAPNQLKLRDTGGSQRRFQSTEKRIAGPINGPWNLDISFLRWTPHGRPLAEKTARLMRKFD